MEEPSGGGLHDARSAAPYETTAKLYRDLVAAGVQGLTQPTEAQVGKLLRPSTATAPLYLRSERTAVGANALAISDRLRSAAPAARARRPRSGTSRRAPRRRRSRRC